MPRLVFFCTNCTLFIHFAYIFAESYNCIIFILFNVSWNFSYFATVSIEIMIYLFVLFYFYRFCLPIINSLMKILLPDNGLLFGLLAYFYTYKTYFIY